MLGINIERECLFAGLPILNPFTIRSYRRISVHCPIFYWCNGSCGQGTVWNFSRTGWRVDGSVEAWPGMEMTIFIFFPDFNEPLKIENTRVRWSRGQEFGLEVTTIPGREEARLWLILQKYLQPQLGSLNG